jgi:hypothetical protein
MPKRVANEPATTLRMTKMMMKRLELLLLLRWHVPKRVHLQWSMRACVTDQQLQSQWQSMTKSKRMTWQNFLPEDHTVAHSIRM